MPHMPWLLPSSVRFHRLSSVLKKYLRGGAPPELAACWRKRRTRLIKQRQRGGRLAGRGAGRRACGQARVQPPRREQLRVLDRAAPGARGGPGRGQAGPAPGADERAVLQRGAHERVLQRMPQRRAQALHAGPRALQEGLVLRDAAQAAGPRAARAPLQHRWRSAGRARGRVGPAAGRPRLPQARCGGLRPPRVTSGPAIGSGGGFCGRAARLRPESARAVQGGWVQPARRRAAAPAGQAQALQNSQRRRAARCPIPLRHSHKSQGTLILAVHSLQKNKELVPAWRAT